MLGVERSVFYFDKPGPVNTDKTLELAKKRALELGVKKVLVATFSGESVFKALEIMKGTKIEIVAVSSASGSTFPVKVLEKWASFNEVPSLKKLLEEWKKKGLKDVPASLPATIAEQLRRKGVKVVYGTDPFYGAPYSIKWTIGGFSTEDVILLSLRLLSPGYGVAVESAAKSVDAGAVEAGELVISTGGTERGFV